MVAKRIWTPGSLSGPRWSFCPGCKVVDVWEKRIGLRTMKIRIRKDEWGESFAHEVNGTAIFAMGADYVPEDSLLSRRSRERTKRLLEQWRQGQLQYDSGVGRRPSIRTTGSMSFATSMDFLYGRISCMPARLTG